MVLYFSFAGLAASFENLSFTYSTPLPLLPLLTLNFVKYLLAWMESTVSLLVDIYSFYKFVTVHLALDFQWFNRHLFSFIPGTLFGRFELLEY